MKDGEIWGLINFPTNYTTEITNRALMGSFYFQNDTFMNKWDNSKITVNLDQTSKLITYTIYSNKYFKSKLKFPLKLSHYVLFFQQIV